MNVSSSEIAVAQGSASRGWLWILLAAVCLLFGVFLLASCTKNQQPPPIAAVPSGLAVPDPRIAYDLREKCGRDAREWFQHFYGDGQSHTKDFSTTSFTNHYQAKLNGCFAVVRGFTVLRDEKTKKSKNSDDWHLVDISENNDLGAYFQFSDMPTPMACSVGNLQCGSREAWETLTAPYMKE